MDQPEEMTLPEPVVPTRRPRAPWVWDLILIGILIVGAYFRLAGLNWDEETHMHPDERFMTMVASSVAPVTGLDEYFDTKTSTLNPNNVGYGFYVYGTLPLFIVRYAAEAVGKSGYGEIYLVGRQLSALADLGTVFLVYLIALRLFRKPRIGLVAAAFYAMAVLPIQLSHYFKEDTFVAFFSTLAIYFALRILPIQRAEGAEDGAPRPWADFAEYLLFALAFGMALASKISIAPLAGLLPLAALIWWLSAPAARREELFWPAAVKLVVAGLFALLVFRVCQPYAFSGPGFFGLVPNEQWVNNMREIANQNSGDVDFPPQLQWARRPLSFSLQNQVVYGLGLPLGAAAWLAFLVMGWRILRGDAEERRRYLLIWLWTGAYFAWQSISVTRTMRYQMPTYPLLTVIAAWGLFALHGWGKTRLSWQRVLAGVGGVSVMICTAAWAYAFLDVFTQPFTRAEASRWIYQNVPGPVNLSIETEQGAVNQPLSFTHGSVLPPQTPVRIAFTAQKTGQLQLVAFDHIVDASDDSAMRDSLKPLSVVVEPFDSPGQALGRAMLADVFPPEGDSRGKSFNLSLDAPVTVEAGKTYTLVMEVAQANARLKLSGSLLLGILADNELIYQPLPEPEETLSAGSAMVMSFKPVKNGSVQRIFINRLVDWEANPGEKQVDVVLSVIDGGEMGEGSLTGAFLPGADIRGEGVWVELSRAVELETDRTYTLSLFFQSGPGRLAIYGSKHANETTWDDALPLGVDGYDPYSYNTGIYRTDLNFEMYWDDNPEKLDRFLKNLEQSDYIFISSNRQWGTTIRVPERYPLTTLYYRSLLGCPVDKDLYWCYAVAQPGQFVSDLGFELVHTVQSEPTLGPITVNTQFAEEAFTVYDHPKVLIFKKTAAYDRDKVRALLKTIDLSTVVHLTPAKAGSYVGNLMLPADRLALQRAGGTWAALFDRDALQNRFPGLGAVLWYLALSLLSWLVYPIVRLALRGLPDHGYPLARLAGMLLLAYPVWLLGSAGVPFERWTIALVALGLAIVGAVFAWLQRRELAEELRGGWRYFLAVEGIALGFFLLFLLVRLGNGDLWHQWKGGEKPMDFSYFNAVLKSTVFPPYDPWLAGGYINYYYYGFVLVGVPVKLLGIVPSIAYNLILPTLFSMLAMGGFSAAWNILSAAQPAGEEKKAAPFGGGLTAALFLVVIGNLGTVRMIWHGLMRLAAPDGNWGAGNIFQRIGWTFAGILRYIQEKTLHYATGDWYWIPSRALPSSAGDPITEFPAFTFLYADLHAHMIALPLTVLGLSWALSIVLGQWRWGDGEGRLKILHFVSSFALAGVAIGALRPTNTWDFPTYLALGLVAVVYTALRNAPAWSEKVSLQTSRAVTALGCAALLGGLALAFYQPFAHWYGQGYNSVALYENGHSPSWSYLTHWGLFLFMIVTYLFIETIDWMAKTPLSALNKLRPKQGLIWSSFGLLVVITAVLLVREVWIVWIALPLMAWAAVLLLRPGMAPARRAMLFMVGTGLALTLFVELVVLVGDINRMNTVFKFYLQAWVLLGLAAAVSLAWSFNEVERLFTPFWRTAWNAAAAVLLGGALLFPLLAGADKVTDRMSPLAPRTLDGMTYMATATYNESDTVMTLGEDYRAILWMQENIAGSPVIVEGSVGEYRWGNRYTIYTGLPSVVGWNWHQRQQRAVTPEIWVTGRVAAVGEFYTFPDPQQALDFLKRYEVSYIVVGQMERAIYPPEGLAKFKQEDGRLWDAVYRDGQTAIYKVR